MWELTDGGVGEQPRHRLDGIGKTTLLDQFRLRVRAAGRHAIVIDGGDVDRSPEGFLTALDRAAVEMTRPTASSGPIRSSTATAGARWRRHSGPCASEGWRL